jgi:TRAP-type C4-dicarboxylate transport system permease large subunit
MIGLITPPVGLCLYTISQVANVPLMDIIREVWPYLIGLLVVLFIITFAPGFVMWLPSLLGFA